MLSTVNGGSTLITDELLLLLDPGNKKSYLGTGVDYINLVGKSDVAELINSPAFVEEFGGVLDFDGVNDYVQLDKDLISYNRINCTFSVWARVDSIHGGWKSGIMSIWDTGAANNNEFMIGLYSSTGPERFNVTIQTSNNLKYSVLSQENYEVGRWYNLTLAVDCGINNMKFYLNGVEEGQYTNANITSVYSGSTMPFRLASFNANPTLYAGNFSVGMSQIYNKTLSAKEVLQNYNATKHRYI